MLEQGSEITDPEEDMILELLVLHTQLQELRNLVWALPLLCIRPPQVWMLSLDAQKSTDASVKSILFTLHQGWVIRKNVFKSILKMGQNTSI